MKKVTTLLIMTTLFWACDPVAQMEANVENATEQNLTVVFASSDDNLNKTLQIAPGKFALFQEGFDIGNTYIEPSLIEYDSVYIKNKTNEILKVYKSGDPGKNIYNVSDDWSHRDRSKFFSIHTYEIRSEDID